MICPYVKSAEELRANQEQWAVYESGKNCVVLAGPGSGKTKTITVKIARLLQESIRAPRRLACITYSNECVSELRRRLLALEADDPKRLLVSTVHSFALTELVIPFAELGKIVVPDPLKVATPSQSNKIFGQAYKDITGYPLKRYIRTAIDKLRRQVPDRHSSEWLTSDQTSRRIIERYEELLLENGLIDFDGIVLAGLKLVENFVWVRRALQAKYPIIVVDEYQDLGVALDRMIRCFIDEAGIRVIAVGDPDQSIYGFTGANPELLRELSRRSDVESIKLRLNYRCATEIVSASRALIPGGIESESYGGRTGSIVIYEARSDVKAQARLAFEKLLPEIIKNNPKWNYGDIAFLYRSYNEGGQIARIADELGFSYFRSDNGSPVKRSRLTNWLTEMAQWCAGGWRDGKVSLTTILKNWRLLRRSLSEGVQTLSERARLIQVLFASRDEKLPLRDWLDGLHTSVIKDMLAQEPNLADEKEIFSDLFALTEEGNLFSGFSVEIFANQGRSPNQLNLMTLHGSKGLEFQAVIMVGLEEGEFPSRYATSDEEKEEATRLFYVGVTRAKNLVYLMYDQKESPLVSAIRQATSA